MGLEEKEAQAEKVERVLLGKNEGDRLKEYNLKQLHIIWRARATE